MNRCFIVSAGQFYGLRDIPDENDFVIAADAGYNTCLSIGLVPDLLVGDFDSMAQPAGFDHILRAPVEKDDTDTMLAVREGLSRGSHDFIFYGATGGKRLDHTLANLQTLLWLRKQGAYGRIYDDDFVYTAIWNETLTIPKTVEWGLVSVFCLGTPAKGVSESGMQYTLENAALTVEQTLTVSNHFLADHAVVTVRDGMLLVGWQLPPLSKADGSGEIH